jgi:hypothetical protein
MLLSCSFGGFAMRRDTTKVILQCLELTQWDPLTFLGRAREVERYLEGAGYVIVPAEMAALDHVGRVFRKAEKRQERRRLQ